jgi:hypothetical protein
MELQGLGTLASILRRISSAGATESVIPGGSNSDMESRDMGPLGDMKLGIDFDLSVLVSYNPMGIIMTLSSRR